MRRKQKVLLLLLFISTYCNAQLDKKTWLIGGNGSLQSYKQEYSSQVQGNITSKNTGINISAAIGYFIFDKFGAGLKSSYSLNKGKRENGDILYESPTQLLIGPFIRYYFLHKENQYNLLMESSYQIGINKYPTSNDKGNARRFQIVGGAEVFFNSSIGMEFLLGYNSSYEDFGGSGAYEQVNKGLITTIGLQFHLTK